MLIVFYAFIIIQGILSMGFQLLASRLLSPHFGSSIIVWAWLISTFLAAFSLGSMLGGWISKVPAERRLRVQATVGFLGLAALAVTVFWGRPILELIEVSFTSMNAGLLTASIGLFFLPVLMLSSLGPQCVNHLAVRGMAPGAASGLVYGISTLGNIAGVMLTAFVLIPNFRVSHLLYGWLGVAVISTTVLVALLQSPAPRTP